VTKPRRKTRREQAAALREKAAAKASGVVAESPENRANHADPNAPIPGLTRKRMAFAVCWAEADPEDSMSDIARRAGYSESSSNCGFVAEMCRDPNILKMRDRRLAELQKCSEVTVEDTLISLRLLAKDPMTPAKDRVAANKTILAWYSSNKGQHKPEAEAPAAAKSTDDWAREMQIDVLGIALDEPA
jgi:hypothetical protein